MTVRTACSSGRLVWDIDGAAV